ncbi:DHH family phosphoesterase [Clostridium sp.]|uniref:DHH family phosphoesterase n=1 Tax=Clostridium sp. TaxID=1506 RepID=UPI002602BEE9|nr:DHH family phosphoesterase [Clostridium sp.]
MRKFWESIYSPNYINGYNPFILKDMNKALEHLVEAINNRKKIVIYGIPTVDGLCAIASLSLVLKYLNADIEYLIHDEDKAGITTKSIKDDVSFLGGQILITLGIDLNSDCEEKLCKDLGIDLIVLENKEVNNEKNYIYINPRNKGCQYRYKNLSVSGLTFKMMQAIAIYYNIKSINRYLDLILIGEQWAKVPLKGENGVFIKEGRKFLVNTNNYGLRAIMNFYNITEMNNECIIKIIEMITPIINAVKKMDNARIIIELLTTNNKDRAEQITKYLNKSNITI